MDVQNIYYTVRDEHGSHFDYGTFLREVTSGRKLVKAIAYATDRGDSRQVKFQNILREIGFEVKLQPFMQRRDGSAKGDWTSGLHWIWSNMVHTRRWLCWRLATGTSPQLFESWSTNTTCLLRCTACLV